VEQIQAVKVETVTSGELNERGWFQCDSPLDPHWWEGEADEICPCGQGYLRVHPAKP
jgi:hypothetical protein